MNVSIEVACLWFFTCEILSLVDNTPTDVSLGIGTDRPMLGFGIHYYLSAFFFFFTVTIASGQFVLNSGSDGPVRILYTDRAVLEAGEARKDLPCSVVNTKALWLNIVFLMFVCLIPFTTRLVGAYDRQEVALTLYGANLMAISLGALAHWRYAARAGLLEEAGKREMRKATKRLLIGAGLFAVAIALAFVEPRWSLAVLMIVPVLHILPGPIHVDWTR